jgi:DNA invertase Pin-like site-specific DNA recombinase
LGYFTRYLLKAFGYCRVSTTEQQDEGVSLLHQQERIGAWAKANGHELAGIYVEARSGGRADNRPEFKRAMGVACREGGILVVYSLSRFSRSVRESLDTANAVGKMFFRLMSVLAEFERDQLRERTTNAMSHLRQQNRRISNKIPLGYDLAADGSTLVPNEREQAVISTIVARRSGGMTLWAVARSMEAEGIPTKMGGKWSPNTVLAILRRHEKMAA